MFGQEEQMKHARAFWSLILVLFIATAATTAWSQQNETPGTTPVSIIASVEAKHGKEVPTVYKQDVRVLHNKERLQVTDWTPCQSDQAGLQLFILVDDATGTDVGLQFADLKKFMESQPSSTAVGVAYARNGVAQVVQNPTNDHAQAAKALRLPMGFGATASPYLSVTDLIKRWPQGTSCREILMVSSGIDFLQLGPQDSYLLESIDQAQRAAIQVYAIYASAVGHAGHSYWLNYWGQYDLSEIADETGGEFYIQGLTPPIAYAPYLDQYANRLTHQFRLTFLAKPGNKGEFQSIHLETEVTNAELVGPKQVYIPAGNR
jgi:hypothetical protein